MTEGTGDIDIQQITSRMGLREPPEVLEASATPIRRGHHLALLAAEGSGKASVVAFALMEACDPEVEGVQALVLVPDARQAWRTAAAVQQAVGPEGLRIGCPSAAPEEDRPADSVQIRPDAQVLVGRPSRMLPDIRAGLRSIADLRLLVIDGVADLRALGEWGSVEPILETVPEGCKKIAISSRSEPAFDELIERQLPRARRWPEELLPSTAFPDGEASESASPHSPVRCVLTRESGFAEAFERCVRDADGLGCGGVELICPDPDTAARAACELAVTGLDASVREGGRTVVVGLPGEGPMAVVQVGLPRRLDDLVTAFEGDGPRYVVVEPRHAAQLELLARRMHRETRSLRGQQLHEWLDPVRLYRTRIRDAAESADLMSELLILEPLFEELGSVRVAAALSELLRSRDESDAEPAPVRTWPDIEAASLGPAGRAARKRRREKEEVPVGARPAWTRLYFGIGRRDEARPGDIVGAITGETGIAGAQIGKIEIMGSFSLVDVDSQVADQVIRSLDGVTIRGRTVPVRHDRES